MVNLLHSRLGSEIGKMEFDEAEFLKRLEQAKTGEEIRQVIDSIPLTQEELEELAELEKMGGRASILMEQRMMLKRST